MYYHVLGPFFVFLIEDDVLMCIVKSQLQPFLLLIKFLPMGCVLWFLVHDLAFASMFQEISIAANVAQKEIGKYIKILGEALQLSQPINSNSISVHMPRFCTLLQLNKSAQVPLFWCRICYLN